MKKKIIALFLACVMCVSVLVIPASADVTNIPSNMNHFVNDVSEDFNAYRNGNISLTDFIELYVKNVAKFQYNSTTDILQIKDVLKHLQKLGVDVPDKWIKWFYTNKMGGGGSAGNRDDSILKGYGALLKKDGTLKTQPDKSWYLGYVYCDYIIVKKKFYDGYFSYIYEYFGDFKLIATDGFTVMTPIIASLEDFSNRSDDDISVYGDVRYDDGSQADDIKEKLPEKQVPNFDDDSVSDNDLINFLDKLLEELRLSYPDLSNIEGLLNAILAKLGTLDSDDDVTALAEINAAIITLATKSDANTQQLLSALTDLKEALTAKKDEDKNGTDLKEITDLLKDMKKSLKYLCDINTLDFIEDILDDLTDEEKNFLNTYAGLITSLIDKFGLSSINSMISSLNSVILNTCAPADLVVNVYGEDVTILSTDIFNSEAMKYIDLAKTFVSILLLYAFCMNMRRKLTT